jgi:hypothetical protein
VASAVGAHDLAPRVDPSRPACDGTEEHHGFLLRHGRYRTIDHPDGAYQYVTVPYGIDDRGRVVGTYSDAGGLTHGFLLRRRTFTDIDVPDAPYVTRCFGINVHGWIVGDYFDAGGVRHGFRAHGASRHDD